MTEEVKVDLAYVEEIFESRTECVHFLLLVQAEFQEALGNICQSIQEQNLYSLRKTLHNVDTHLEMIGATEVQDFLRQVKSKVAGLELNSKQKQDLAQKTEGYFKALLHIISTEIQK